MFPLSDQAGTPAAPTPPQQNPPPISRGKEKPPTPVGRSAALSKSQTLAGKSQSRSGESRGIVAKSLGIVVSHSRKP